MIFYILSQRQEGWTVLPQHYDDGGFTQESTRSVPCHRCDRPIRYLPNAVGTGDVEVSERIYSDDVGVDRCVSCGSPVGGLRQFCQVYKKGESPARNIAYGRDGDGGSLQSSGRAWR